MHQDNDKKTRAALAPLGNEDAPPTFACETTNGGWTWWFFCPACKRRHTHGRGLGVGGGHRVAHCDSVDSPYWKSGYFIVRRHPEKPGTYLTEADWDAHLQKMLRQGRGCWGTKLPSE